METSLIDIKTLRKGVKKALIDRELDRHGAGKHILLPLIAAKLGKSVHIRAYYMAMNGYRNNPTSRTILTALFEIMQDWPDADVNVNTASRDFIHASENSDK